MSFLGWNTRSALTALGTNQATAFVISGTDTALIFSTVAASTGCILPNGLQGTRICVRNDGVAALSVYPPVGGTMNGGTTNAAFSLASGGSQEFTSKDNLAWFTVQGGSQSRTVAAGITTATTVTPSQSGTLFPLLTGSAGGITVSLPAPTTAGMEFIFFVDSTLSNAVTIASTGANMCGTLTNQKSADGSGTNTVTLFTNFIYGTTSSAGDRVVFQSTGSKYIITSTSQIVSSITKS